MGFEVAPDRLGGGRRWPAVVVALVAVGLVAAAILGRSAEEGGQPLALASRAPSPATGSRQAPRPASAGAASFVPPSGAPASRPPSDGQVALRRPPPDAIACIAVPRADCSRAVRAALDVVDPSRPEAVSASVSASLICGSLFDCPHSFLRSGRAVGSVQLRFADGDQLLINVIEPPPDGVRESGPPELLVRPVRGFG